MQDVLEETLHIESNFIFKIPFFSSLAAKIQIFIIDVQQPETVV